MQKFIATGRLTNEPESSETAAGHTVVRFSIAIRRDYKNADGDYTTDFFNCVTWNTTAKFIQKYCHKGDKVLIVGTVENRQYKNADGDTKKFTEIQVQSVESLMQKDKGEETAKESPRQQLQQLEEEDLPF